MRGILDSFFSDWRKNNGSTVYYLLKLTNLTWCAFVTWRQEARTVTCRQHPLYKALKEFGKIPKTLFILKYVDDPQFRQSIEKQLNKVEGSHKLSKAISLGNDHAFLQGDKGEQEIAEGCRRLIKNVLMCWNYLYLSKEIKEEKDEERKRELIEIIKNDSVMRWSHFNLGGEYDFSDEKMVDSVGLETPKKHPVKSD